MVPRDPESIKLLADDAEDLAMSWGKPAGRMAYTAVDSIVFVIFSRSTTATFCLFVCSGLRGACLSRSTFFVDFSVSYHQIRYPSRKLWAKAYHCSLLLRCCVL